MDAIMMPNFLIIGAQKAGTTALYDFLSQHDQVFMSPIKEPKFFALEGHQLDFNGPKDRETISKSTITDFNAYQNLFNGVMHETAVGEASTWYLYSQEAPLRIQQFIPKAKLIAILRHPAERAFSAYMHLIRDGREPIRDFMQALQKEDERIRNHWTPLWHYKHVGLYNEQIRRYYNAFCKDQIQIHLYEDFKEKPLEVLRSIADFLNITPFKEINIGTAYNASGIPKSRFLDDFISNPNIIKDLIKPILPKRFRQEFKNNIRNRFLKKTELPEQAKKLLIREFREDILQLQDLIDRDLSAWLE